MGKGRLEAFSDGVIAVIITIMVLELKAPHGNDLAALEPLVPGLLSYVVSFVFVGIYWNNHHHMLHAAARIDGRVLWANLHLLFWLSLVPFVTSWVSESLVASIPTALYGVVLLMAGVAYLLLQRSLVKVNGADSALARAVGHDFKGKVSALLYVSAIVLAFVKTWVADAIYVFVVMMWLIPDRRIERTIRSGEAPTRPTP
ncbi:MAG TPA: TMEM175 family protein [Gemmatimonadales bacterium]|nr:TMEM175 family protein [Gemmatimonadales bacterium]